MQPQPMMQAVVHDRYGSAEVLDLRQIPKPQTGDDDVLVRVHAAGLDRGVWHLMTGLPYIARLGLGLRGPNNPVVGMDVAGRVEAFGKNVKRFQVGDEVFGTCRGSFAELACVNRKKLALKPASLTLVQAAAIPISGGTALQGLRDKAKLAEGQSVLITGASGGVGTFAVQIAKALGARVTGVCSTAKMDRLQSMGVDHVVDYTRRDFTQTDVRYDVIFDIAGNRPLAALRRILTPKGTLVIVGGEEGGKWLGGIDRGLRASLLSPFLRQRMLMFVGAENVSILEGLSELVEAGKVTPVIDEVFPLHEVPRAMRRLTNGEAFGKIVISVADR